MSPLDITLLVLAAVVGGALGFFLRQRSVGAREAELKTELSRIDERLDEKQRELELKAREDLQRQREGLETQFEKRRSDLRREEERLDKRREDLDSATEQLSQRERELSKRQSALDRQRNELEQQQAEQIAELERISGLTRNEAKEHLLAMVEKDARDDMARTIRQIEEDAKEEGERRARKLIVAAMQRVASQQVSDYAVTVVPIPSDELKGRIIGRNGRNIRAFEQASGVDVIVDDTPEAVTVSSFDPARREIARRALTKLIQDGRIHPAYIEKVVADARDEVDAVIKEEGERASFEASVPGLHPEILRLLGRLKFRTSYGQDQNAHAIETALLAGAIAAEVGANVELAKAGALLHDIGKAVDHEVEGTHAAIGAEIARRYGVNPLVCNCIAAHHHEVEQETVEAAIVEIADAISGARPGARRESLDQYLKRVRTLEEIANSFDGVDHSYALQAGREVRIMVTPEKVDDLSAIQLSKNVARRIEESMQYPGQVKVTVIRETRAVDYAK
ncbi:MAG: ribonuclease Y [Anaerolineales bacterium]